MTDDEMTKLASLAEKATKGPWVRGKREKTYVWFDFEDPGHFVASCRTPEGGGNSDAAYIAAAHPQAVKSLIERVRIAELERDEARKLRAMLRSAMCLIHGLACPGCKTQGREMAAPGKCCRDADCDAGWYGIGCDEVKDFLEAAEALMPGTLAEIENPPAPVNEETPRV